MISLFGEEWDISGVGLDFMDFDVPNMCPSSFDNLSSPNALSMSSQSIFNLFPKMFLVATHHTVFHNQVAQSCTLL